MHAHACARDSNSRQQFLPAPSNACTGHPGQRTAQGALLVIRRPECPPYYSLQPLLPPRLPFPLPPPFYHELREPFAQCVAVGEVPDLEQSHRLGCSRPRVAAQQPGHLQRGEGGRVGQNLSRAIALAAAESGSLPSSRDTCTRRGRGCCEKCGEGVRQIPLRARLYRRGLAAIESTAASLGAVQQMSHRPPAGGQAECSSNKGRV